MVSQSRTMNNNHFLFVAFFQLHQLGKSLQLVNYKHQHQSYLISFLIYYSLPGLFKAPKMVPFFMSKAKFQATHDIRLLYWLCFTATSGDALKVSPAVLSMSKNISRLQVYDYLPFSNPTDKTKIETAKRWETNNSHPPGLVNQGAANNHIYYALLWQVFAMPFTSLSKLSKFFWAKPKCFDFSSSNYFLCRVTYWAPLWCSKRVREGS